MPISSTTQLHRILVLLLFFVAIQFARQGQAQNSPACDSIYISNFRFDTIPGQLALEGANESSLAINYPGFIFFDTNMDTLAREVVDYFIMGNLPTTYKLVIKNPINLPQSGFLSVYGGFYDTLYCTWPVVLQDTPLTINKPIYGEVSLYPNPVATRSTNGLVSLRWTARGIDAPYSATVFNLSGQVVAELPRIGMHPVFSVADWTPGLYLVQVRTYDQRQICIRKLLVQ